MQKLLMAVMLVATLSAGISGDKGNGLMGDKVGNSASHGGGNG